MNPDFQQLMKDAAQLTRNGDLQASVAAIQAALADAKPPLRADATGDVIDVEARVVREDSARQDAAASDTAPASFLSGTFSNHAGALDYKLFVPALTADRPIGLVVMLHGCTQNPDDFAAGTQMNKLAAERNALVLYPAQSRRANPQGCWNWFKHNHQTRSRGEPAILAGMATEIIARYGISTGHVFVAGLSAGGAMAAILGDTHPELFAAVGIHSGLPAGAATDLPSALSAMKGQITVAPAAPGATPVPTIVFHGDADTTVHPANGLAAARAVTGNDAGEQQASGSNGSSNGRRHTRQLFRTGEGRVMAEHWSVHGAGHAWSGGSPAGSYTDARGPDASREMLRFFWEHARKR